MKPKLDCGSIVHHRFWVAATTNTARHDWQTVVSGRPDARGLQQPPVSTSPAFELQLSSPSPAQLKEYISDVVLVCCRSKQQMAQEGMQSSDYADMTDAAGEE
eukprot:1642627-Rhodomonas_salina.1